MKEKNVGRKRIGSVIGLMLLIGAVFGVAMIPLSMPVAGQTATDLDMTLNTTRSHSSLSVTPGGTADFYVVLNNKNATLDMSVRMSASSVSSGFSVVFVNESSGSGQTSYTVPAGEVRNVTVRVSAETDIVGGTIESFVVTAYDRTRSLTDTLTLTVTVDTVFALTQRMTSGGSVVYSKWVNTSAGGSAVYQVYVENTGNSIISTSYVLNTTAFPGDWSAKIVDSLITQNVITGHSSIAPDGVRFYYVIVSTDDDDTAGDNYALTSTATIIGATSPTYTQRVLTMTTRVSADFDDPRWVATGVVTQTGAIGETIVFGASLKNDNTVAVNAILSVPVPTNANGIPASGWTIEIYDDSGTTSGEYDANDELLASTTEPSFDQSIVAHGSLDIWIVVTVPATADSGDNTIRVLATFTALADRGVYTTAYATVEADATATTPSPIDFSQSYMGLPMWVWLLIVAIIVLVAIGFMSTQSGRRK